MRNGILTLALIVAAAAAGEEFPVSAPRLELAPGQRLEGVVASEGKSAIAAWTDRRIAGAIFATRVTLDGEVLDPYGIRIEAPTGFYLSEPAAVFGGGTMLLGMRVSDGRESRVGVVRIAADGTRIDEDVKILGDGGSPAIAWNGETFLVASATRDEVTLTLLSPRLEVLTSTKFPGTTPRVAANGRRYLCTFKSGAVVRGVIVEGGVAGEAFDIAESGGRSFVAAAGEGWAVAIATSAIEVCAVTTEKGVTCGRIAKPETSAYVSDIVAAEDALIVAWYSEAVIRPVSLPLPPVYDFHLTRVTRDGAAELPTKPGAPPAEDDVLISVRPGEATRVGRKGVVTDFPVALGSPEQLLHALLPSGDGATAFWSELPSPFANYELHATRFTAGGIDPAFHDRVFGMRVQPLGSDGTNILLSDGRVIDPAGTVIRSVAVPREAVLGAWDGREWVVATYTTLHRGRETFASRHGFPLDLACNQHGCVLAWTERKNKSPFTVDVRALYIAADRPLSRARRMRLATVTDHQSVGAAATKGSLLVTWPDHPAKAVYGLVFGPRGRVSAPFPIGHAVSWTDTLFSETGSGKDDFLVLRNAWPTMYLVRVAPSGAIVSTSELKGRDGTGRGVAEVGGRVLVFFERNAPEPPYASTRRAFVSFEP